MIRKLLLVTCLFCAMPGYSQFADSTTRFISYAATGVINNTNNSRSYVFTNAVKFSVRKKRLSLNSNSSWIYGWQQHNLTNNDLSSSLDFNLYRSSKRFYYWGLAAYEKNYSLKINSRGQAGLGAAYSFVDRESTFFNISNGLLFEASNLKLNDTVNTAYRTLRNSLRIRHRFVLNQVVVLDGTHFWQPSLIEGRDYILKSNTTLSVKLRRWLNLTAAATYNRVNRTQRENLLVTFGVTAETYF